MQLIERYHNLQCISAELTHHGVTFYQAYF